MKKRIIEFLSLKWVPELLYSLFDALRCAWERVSPEKKDFSTSLKFAKADKADEELVSPPPEPPHRFRKLLMKFRLTVNANGKVILAFLAVLAILVGSFGNSYLGVVGTAIGITIALLILADAWRKIRLRRLGRLMLDMTARMRVIVNDWGGPLLLCLGLSAAIVGYLKNNPSLSIVGICISSIVLLHELFAVLPWERLWNNALYSLALTRNRFVNALQSAKVRLIATASWLRPRLSRASTKCAKKARKLEKKTKTFLQRSPSRASEICASCALLLTLYFARLEVINPQGPWLMLWPISFTLSIVLFYFSWRLRLDKKFTRAIKKTLLNPAMLFVYLVCAGLILRAL